VALNAAMSAVGVVVLLVAGIPARRPWLPTIAGLAPATGIAACGLAASVGAMVGIDVRALSTGPLVVGALLIARLSLGSRRPTLASLSPPRPGSLARILELVCLAGLAVLSVGILRLAAASSLDGWDGWAVWGPKAHALFVEGDVWGPVFREPAYLMQHQEYPVLLPALEALSAGAIGRFDPTLTDIEAAFVLVAFGWAAWALLRLVVVPSVAAAVGLALTASPQLAVNTAANYADTVVAAFTALGLLGLFLWLTRGSTTTLALAAVFLAAAGSTKAEGLLFAVCAVASALAVARGFGRSVRSSAVFGIGVLAVPIAWRVVDRLNGPGAENIETAAFTDPGYAADAADRIPAAADRLLDEIANGWSLAALAVVGALAVACLARLWWHALFVALWAVLGLASLVVVYYAFNAPIDWLLGTSADRVVLSIVLGLATVSPLLVVPAWERATGGREPTIP
jgi:hypothetical protein